MQKNDVFNKFLLLPNFFFIASYQIFKNDAILINNESVFQEKESSQLYRSQFLELLILELFTEKTVPLN